jgi:hypothetical protein
MEKFPEVITFEDTGERRWPRYGEWYLFLESGEVSGQHGGVPVPNDEHTELTEGTKDCVWRCPPEAYAIYRRNDTLVDEIGQHVMKTLVSAMKKTLAPESLESLAAVLRQALEEQ